MSKTINSRGLTIDSLTHDIRGRKLSNERQLLVLQMRREIRQRMVEVRKKKRLEGNKDEYIEKRDPRCLIHFYCDEPTDLYPDDETRDNWSAVKFKPSDICGDFNFPDYASTHIPNSWSSNL